VQLRPGRERARDTLQYPAEQAAADRLIAAGILEDKAGLLRPTERTEATFGVCSIRRPGSSPSVQTFFEGLNWLSPSAQTLSSRRANCSHESAHPQLV